MSGNRRQDLSQGAKALLDQHCRYLTFKDGFDQGLLGCQTSAECVPLGAEVDAGCIGVELPGIRVERTDLRLQRLCPA